VLPYAAALYPSGSRTGDAGKGKVSVTVALADCGDAVSVTLYTNVTVPEKALREEARKEVGKGPELRRASWQGRQRYPFRVLTVTRGGVGAGLLPGAPSNLNHPGAHHQRLPRVLVLTVGVYR
jgi:hypothetical protein